MPRPLSRLDNKAMTAGDQTGQPTVLVVDDEQNFRDLLRNRFAAEGWIVLEAGSMAEAFPICRRMPPDVLVLDHSMPGLTGIEAGRILVREGFRSPIVLFSAYLTPELRDDCRSLGLHAVDKINFEELVLTCEELLAEKSPQPV
jgi:two-component system, OmpR family, response regulator MprA